MFQIRSRTDDLGGGCHCHTSLEFSPIKINVSNNNEGLMENLTKTTFIVLFKITTESSFQRTFLFNSTVNLSNNITQFIFKAPQYYQRFDFPLNRSNFTLRVTPYSSDPAIHRLVSFNGTNLLSGFFERFEYSSCPNLHLDKNQTGIKKTGQGQHQAMSIELPSWTFCLLIDNKNVCV